MTTPPDDLPPRYSDPFLPELRPFVVKHADEASRRSLALTDVAFSLAVRRADWDTLHCPCRIWSVMPAHIDRTISYDHTQQPPVRVSPSHLVFRAYTLILISSRF